MTSTSDQTPPSLSLMNLPEGLTPDSIDTLTVLSAILARLETPSSTTNLNTSTAGSPPAATPSQLAHGDGPLTIKDIPAATDGLKHDLQKARVLVKKLPDMERSTAEQEEEIQELEEKIRQQRDVLEQLRGVGSQIKRERAQRVLDAGADVMET